MKAKKKDKSVVKGSKFELRCGDSLELLRSIPTNSIDSVVCDPPYGLEFMGLEFDTFTVDKVQGIPLERNRARTKYLKSKYGTGIEKDSKSAGGFGKDSATNENAYGAARVRYGKMNKLFTERPAKQKLRETGRNRATDKPLPCYSGGKVFEEWNRKWAVEVLRVLKPGGHLLAFGGSRTHHRLIAGIEDAGFEIRDTISWIFGSGFPKSHQFWKGKPELVKYEGHGTALKPAQEYICVARKPLGEKTVAANVLKYGTGGLNIQACEIGRAENDVPGWHKSGAKGSKGYQGTKTFKIRDMDAEDIQSRLKGKGRWPANVIFSGNAVEELDKQSGKKRSGRSKTRKEAYAGESVTPFLRGYSSPENQYDDFGGASRFFYCPKPAKKEKDAGLDSLDEKKKVFWQTSNGTSGKASSIAATRNTAYKNSHPTVKPVALMEWLIKLVTPPGGIVLDHFMGSGTTGVAAVKLGFYFIGFEKNPEYFEIAAMRISHAENNL